MRRQLGHFTLFIFILIATLGYYAYREGKLSPLLRDKTPSILKRLTESSTKNRRPLVGNDLIQLQTSFAQVAQSIKPAAVNIATVRITDRRNSPHEFFYGDPQEFFKRFFKKNPWHPPPKSNKYREEGLGSGVLIDPDGFVLTNAHVVSNAEKVTVTLNSGEQYAGEVIGIDQRTDMAVVKVKAISPLPYAHLGNSSDLRVGNWVVAIGSPFGLEQTVTTGIISAIRQSLVIEGKQFRDMIQTDAAINRGNSGGPLLNIHGEVVGINTAIYAPTGVFSGVGFAIPVNRIKNILKDLIEKGRVVRSWLGVEIAKVDEVIAKQFGLKKAEGALINNVFDGTPANKVGLKRGDIVIKFNGKKISNVIDLPDLVSSTPPKTKVDIEIIREGKTKILSLVTEEMPETSSSFERSQKKKKSKKVSTLEWLDAIFSDNSERLTQSFDIPDDAPRGVVLQEMSSAGKASQIGLREGDLIVGINKYKTPTSATLKTAIKSIKIEEGVVFDIFRQGQSFYLSYKPFEEGE